MWGHGWPRVTVTATVNSEEVFPLPVNTTHCYVCWSFLSRVYLRPQKIEDSLHHIFYANGHSRTKDTGLTYLGCAGWIVAFLSGQINEEEVELLPTLYKWRQIVLLSWHGKLSRFPFRVTASQDILTISGLRSSATTTTDVAIMKASPNFIILPQPPSTWNRETMKTFVKFCL